MSIDKNKTYRTRDGRDVRIYATDGAKGSIHGAVKSEAGWLGRTWFADGSWYSDGTKDPIDLVEVKPRIRRKVWVNVFPRYCLTYSTRRDADLDNAERIACVEIDIDVEEGHGL